MRHCVRGSGCSQHYLNYDATVLNSDLPKTASEALILNFYVTFGVILIKVETSGGSWAQYCNNRVHRGLQIIVQDTLHG